tara:strand:+ start:3808 stop:6045 length:2238 start_codon:yes stop_codon:yes gene_type:complete
MAVYKNQILDKRLEFLYKLHSDGIELDKDYLVLLKKHDYIKDDSIPVHSKQDFSVNKYERNYEVKIDVEQEADKYVEVVDEKEDVVYYGKEEIKVSDWKPSTKKLLDPPADFVKWIDSINVSFAQKVNYTPYNKYVQQAENWLAQNESLSDYKTYDEQLEFARREKKRCTDNSLYFLNKYLMLKEGDTESGYKNYKAWECQTIVCFVFDCGYNIMIGKPRQVGFTSTIGGLAVKRTVFHKSYFTKFITETLKKGEEIFEDKIKFAFYTLPDWLRPTVNNDRENLLRLFYKPAKGDIGGVDSKLMVDTPRVTAINGGAPNLVMIDEIGLISILTEMMNEGRPALFWVNPDTNEMEMKRQLICWGTGGEMEGGGLAFEREFKTASAEWKQRNFKYGIIPLFFDAYAKPGVTKDFYETEKKYYYKQQGMDSERSRIQFHQAYPLTMDDMFLISSDTIIPVERINERLDAIYAMPIEQKPQRGYFEPIFDESRPFHEGSDVAYHIKGAKFIPVDDVDPAATVTIFEHPEEGWRYRYFQGTDPIFSESGHSKMASAVWDSHHQTISAHVNFRVEDYRYCYLQTLLLGLYYDKSYIYNLLEYNVGSGYIDYVENKNYFKTLVPGRMIAPHLRTQGGSKMGISKKANTAKYINYKLSELLESYAENVFCEDFWIQLKTYVRKRTKSGIESFKVENAKYYYDDVIDAVIYAYICAQSYAHFEPYKMNESRDKKVKYRYIRDKNYNLKLKRIVE